MMSPPVYLRHVILSLGLAHALLLIAVALLDDRSVAAALAGARLSVAVGVIVAYAPVIFSAPLGVPLGTGLILSIGILIGWISHALLGAYTLLYQAGIAGSAPVFVAYASMLADFSGMMHLAAAAAIKGNVPLKGWVRAGLIAAFGMAAALSAIALLAA